MGIVEVERRLPVAHADRHRRDAVDYGILGNDARSEKLAHGVFERDHAARDRRAPRAAVGLQNVAVYRYLALAELRHVDCRAKRTPDEALYHGRLA